MYGLAHEDRCLVRARPEVPVSRKDRLTCRYFLMKSQLGQNQMYQMRRGWFDDGFYAAIYCLLGGSGANQK